MKNVVQQAQKPREELNLPILSFEVADSWIDYLGYEQFCWWLKFHSWVNRSDSKYTENHIPYTLESLFEKLGVSQTTFYRKIKVLWECGLIEIIEFGGSDRKSQKPKNILVYEYPFHERERRFKPLEKLRDWKKDYDSQSKLAGIRGALKKKESNKINPPNSERVENPVDNSPESVDKPVENIVVDNVDNVDNHPPKFDRVDPPKFERVTLPNLGGNNYSNKLLTNTNNSNNNTNNYLSLTRIDLIRETLIAYEFTAGERERIVELLIDRNIYSKISKADIIKQIKYMLNKTDIRDRAIYFVNGIEKNIGRSYPTPHETKESETRSSELPFFNWLED